MKKIVLNLTERQADFLAAVMFDYQGSEDWTVVRDARNVLALLQVARPAPKPGRGKK